ncbi:MAG: hypothetical protein AAF108_03400 [Planctomycetota bacterium]
MTEHTPASAVEAGAEVDEWHLHAADEHIQQAHGEKINSAVLLIAWAASIVLVLVVVGAVGVFFNYTTTKLKAERVESTALRSGYVQYRDEAEAKLDQTAWQNSAEERVRISLDTAIGKVVETYDD